LERLSLGERERGREDKERREKENTRIFALKAVAITKLFGNFLNFGFNK